MTAPQPLEKTTDVIERFVREANALAEWMDEQRRERRAIYCCDPSCGSHDVT
jgi:hypothetical protein